MWSFVSSNNLYPLLIKASELRMSQLGRNNPISDQPANSCGEAQCWQLPVPLLGFLHCRLRAPHPRALLGAVEQWSSGAGTPPPPAHEREVQGQCRLQIQLMPSL